MGGWVWSLNGRADQPQLVRKEARSDNITSSQVCVKIEKLKSLKTLKVALLWLQWN